MTLKERLHKLVDELTEEDLADALDYVEWLLAAEDTLTPAELKRAKAGARRIAQGEYATLEEAKRQLGR